MRFCVHGFCKIFDSCVNILATTGLGVYYCSIGGPGLNIKFTSKTLSSIKCFFSYFYFLFKYTKDNFGHGLRRQAPGPGRPGPGAIHLLYRDCGPGMTSPTR